MKKLQISFLFCLLLELSVATGTSNAELQKIVPSDGVPSDWFGSSLALDGDTLVVGSEWHHRIPGRGAAYVYQRTAGAWNLDTIINPIDSQLGGNFGNAVAIDGSRIIVGDYQHSTNGPPAARASGAAYIFDKSTSGWTQTAEFVPNDGKNDEQLGRAVSIKGDTAIAGGVGSAYVYKLTGGSWQQTQQLTSSITESSAANGFFGSSLALGNGFALVGAYAMPAGNMNSGAVFAYKETPSGFVETDVLRPDTPLFRGSFGLSLAVSGDTAIIGMPNGVPTTTPLPGAAYIFQRNGDKWVQTAKLQASDGINLDSFGSRVAISGNLAAVSSFGTPQGQVYLFENDNGLWHQISQLSTGAIFNTDQFGVGLALNGNTLGIGARLDDQVTVDTGAVHIFLVPEPATMSLVVILSLGFSARCRFPRVV